MSKSTRETKPSIWKRLFVERADARAFVPDPRPVFAACSVTALVSGVVGWTMASVAASWLVGTGLLCYLDPSGVTGRSLQITHARPD